MLILHAEDNCQTNEPWPSLCKNLINDFKENINTIFVWLGDILGLGSGPYFMCLWATRLDLHANCFRAAPITP